MKRLQQKNHRDFELLPKNVFFSFSSWESHTKKQRNHVSMVNCTSKISIDNNRHRSCT